MPAAEQHQLPGQVKGVGDAGVHALGAQRALHVAGVAGEQNAVAAVVADQPPLDGEAAQPAGLAGQRRLVAQGLADALMEQRHVRLGLVVLLIVFALFVLVARLLGDHQPPAVVGHGDGDQVAVGEQEAVEGVVLQVRGPVHIGKQKALVVVVALERQAQQFAHPRMGAVGAHQQLGLQLALFITLLLSTITL